MRFGEARLVTDSIVLEAWERRGTSRVPSIERSDRVAVSDYQIVLEQDGVKQA